MDTLKGLVYLETTKGIENWNIAVEDPNDHTKTRIFICKSREVGRDSAKTSSNKRSGHWKFKAFRFNDIIEKVEIIGKPVSKVIPDIPESLLVQIPITELKKLKLWTD